MKGRKLMDTGLAGNMLTFKLYNLACPFHCKIQSPSESNMSSKSDSGLTLALM